MEIKPIRIPRNVIRELPPPVVDATAPPVTRSVRPPVVDVPSPVIDYPIIDVPTREEFEGMRVQEKPPEEVTPPTRDLPPTNQIDVPGIGPVDLPDPAPLVTAGATAVITTGAALGATVAFTQLKNLAEPYIRQLTERMKSKKIKIKKIKPVIHFIGGRTGVDIIKYSAEGVNLVDTTNDVEKYLRDNVETNSLYEYDNKLVVDENIKNLFTKEGQKRFNRHFIPSKKFVKKLSARVSL